MFITALSLAIALLVIKPAYAYLDPGTGAMIIQAVVGAIVGGLVVIKLYWGKLVGIFCPSKKTAKEEESKTEEKTSDEKTDEEK